MSDSTDFLVHLAIAASVSWLLIWGVRLLLNGINKASKGKFFDLLVIKQLGVVLDILLPLLPCVPSGIIFMAWPSNVILPEPIYQFAAGAVAGSLAANIYEMVSRDILAKIKALTNSGS